MDAGFAAIVLVCLDSVPPQACAEETAVDVMSIHVDSELGCVPALKVIRAHCLDCCGGSPAEVRLCTAVRCPSWPYRMGVDPFRARVELSEEERAQRRTRLARSREKSPEIQEPGARSGVGR